MSIFDRLTPLISQVSASSRQPKEHLRGSLSSPASLSSPLIKKKPIQIPSFDEKGLICEKQSTTERSFVPIQVKTCSQTSLSKSFQHSQRNHGEGASTLPRIKPKTHSSPSPSAKLSASIFSAPKLNSSPTLKPMPNDSLHPPASQLCDPSSLLPHPQVKPSVSPTLTVPTPRLSPSPTSLCQGTSSDAQGSKQPSPVAKERRAKSIPISNTKAEKSSNEAKHNILDQETLLEFTHPVLTRSSSLTSRESRHQTRLQSESQRQVPTIQNSSTLQDKLELIKAGGTAQDKPKTLLRNVDIAVMPKPKTNIKQQQQGSVPSKVTNTQTSASKRIKSTNVAQRKPQTVFDGLATNVSPNLHRKCMDYLQNRHYSQTTSMASNQSSSKQRNTERSAALPVSPKTAPLSQSNLSPNIEARKKRLGLHNETVTNPTLTSSSNLRKTQEDDTTPLSQLFQQPGSPRHGKFLQKSRFWSQAQSQVDVQAPVHQSDCVSKDYTCQSSDIDQKNEASQCGKRLNPLKTCLVAPQTQESSQPALSTSRPDVISHKHQVEPQKSPGQSKKQSEVKLHDMGTDQSEILVPSDHGDQTRLPEYPTEKCLVSWTPSVAECPFDTNSVGIISKGVFDLHSQPQEHRVSERSKEKTTTTTTSSFPPKQPNYTPASKAFIMEEPDDPYYVTMYCPGSIYVGEYRDIKPLPKLQQN